VGFISIRKLRFLPLALAVLYLLFVFTTRWLNQRRYQSLQEQKREAAGRLPKELSGSELKILSFYASPGTLKAGESGLLCYSAINARTVVIEPGGHRLGSSLGRCIAVNPRSTTRYTLTAEDSNGSRLTESVELLVR
jgi:hypothetical protein